MCARVKREMFEFNKRYLQGWEKKCTKVQPPSRCFLFLFFLGGQQKITQKPQVLRMCIANYER